MSHFCEAFERARDVFAIADVGTKGADRPARLGQVGARQIDRRLDARRDSGRQSARFSSGGLKLHQNRGEPLRKAVVDIAREPVSFLENRLPAFFDAAGVCQAAVVQRKRRLACDRFEQGHTPPAVAPRRRQCRDCDPSQIATPQHEGSDDDGMHARVDVEFSNRLRQT